MVANTLLHKHSNSIQHNRLGWNIATTATKASIAAAPAITNQSTFDPGMGESNDGKMLYAVWENDANGVNSGRMAHSFSMCMCRLF